MIDNNSTDDTADVVDRHAAALPVRRVFEPVQGHAAARNRAMVEAEGADLLLWTDDDVLVPSDWLVALAAAADRWPDAAYLGGRIEPHYLSEPPSWVRAHERFLSRLVLRHDLGPDEVPFAPGERPIGANMAFRPSRIPAGMTFDQRLGRKADSRVVGEEQDFFDRLDAAEALGVWVPSARMDHVIEEERVSVAFLADFYEGLGQTHVRLGGSLVSGRLATVPEPVRRAGVAVGARVLGALAALLRRLPGDRWVVPYARAAQLRGVARELSAP